MKDGVELAADFYAPELHADKGPARLIIIQCCYSRGTSISFVNARIFAARGYQARLWWHFRPGSNEQSDSRNIVVWMRQQP